MHWEVLAERPEVRIRRGGRYLVADLLTPHLVLSTSFKNGGLTSHLGHLVNHQSCEGSGHESRARTFHAGGQAGYHDIVCDEIGVPASEAAVMGTAANMHYAALAVETDEDVIVTAVVTAGVQSNATCAGDPASWRERSDGVTKVVDVAGTINTLLVVNAPVTDATIARLVVTMTEGKSAALQRLAVPSCYSPDLATGTGTDQFCIAAPLDGRAPLSSASPHMKFGELVGLAVRTATLEALRWQNGLEPSYTRGVFHALGRYGIKEATILDDITPFLTAEDAELLRRNSKSVFFEPLVGAAAHALATVLDRGRHGALPETVVHAAAVQQAATLATSVAANPDRWTEFRARLHDRGVREPKSLVLAAIALGWTEKWRPR